MSEIKNELAKLLSNQLALIEILRKRIDGSIDMVKKVFEIVDSNLKKITILEEKN